jgi:hypothetical protein
MIEPECLVAVIVTDVAEATEDVAEDVAFEAHVASRLTLEQDGVEPVRPCQWSWYAQGRLDATRAVFVGDMRRFGVGSERIAEVLAEWDEFSQPLAILHVAYVR